MQGRSLDCPTGYVKTSLQRKLIKRLGRLTYYKYIYIFNFTDDIGAVFQWFDLGLFLGVGKPVAASYCVYCSLSHVIYVTLLFQTGKTPFYALCGRQLSRESIRHLFRQI